MNDLITNGRVTLKMLRYFLAVADNNHFGKAAKSLKISASPLSTKVKELEVALDVPLFVRNSRNVELTDAGRLLREECIKMFEVMNSSINSVVKTGRNQKDIINIGLISSAFWVGFSSMVKQFKESSPTSQFNFIELSPNEQKRALADKRIDVGIARFADTFSTHPFSSVCIVEENMCLVVSDEHELKDRKLVSLSELENEKMVVMRRDRSASTELIINSCLIEGFYPHINHDVIEPHTIIAVVASNQSISIVPSSFGYHNWKHVKFIKLKERIPANLCATYNCRNESPIVTNFIEMITKQFPDN